MARLTEKGFTIRRLGEIIVDMKARAKSIFQDLVRPGDEVDTGDTTTLGRMIGLTATSIDNLEQAALQIYQSFDIDSATGNALENLTRLGHVWREQAANTSVDLYLLGRIGSTTPNGFSARSTRTSVNYILQTPVTYTNEKVQGIGIGVRNLKANNQYTLGFRKASTGDYNSVTIAVGDYPNNLQIYQEFANNINANYSDVTAEATDDMLIIKAVKDFAYYDFQVSDDLVLSHAIMATKALSEEVGAFEELPGDITVISAPIYGWEQVTNPTSSVQGRKLETDDELRARFKAVRFTNANNIIESLYSEIYNLAGINSAVIYENDTDVPDEKGLPGHSFMVLVDGGVDIEIGRAIWKNRPAGITSVGNTTVEVIDAYGYIRPTKFSRPIEVPVYIQIKLKRNAQFPADGEQMIKNALEEYVNAVGMDNGVVYSRLYTPINTVQGHQVDSLLIGTDPDNLSTSNIDVNFDQIVKTNDLRITFI